MKQILIPCFALALGACASAPPAATPMTFRTLPVDAGDNLPGVLAIDRDLSFPLFREPADAAMAEAAAGDLAKAYRIVADAVGVDADDVQWAQVSFSRDRDYQPPRHQGVPRWNVPVDPSGALGSAGRTSLYVTVPHEQVHTLQERFGALPRWFSEGMATWAGLKAAQALQPDVASDKRAALERELAAHTPPLKLTSWGALRVKPEAILRQVTEEQRAKMASDPSYVPPGPFSFGPGDVESDESNTGARYAASLAVFDAIESQAGSDAVRAWIAAVGQQPGRKESDDIVRLAKETTGIDVAELISRIEARAAD